MTIQDRFRLAMRRYIYSVSIMSNKDEDKNLNAITVSSVTSISMQPPSLLVCINKNSRIHDSLKLGTKFCVNLLTKDHIGLSDICSSDNKYSERFIDKTWNKATVPFLESAQSNIFCIVDNLVSFHTHSIVIGLVEDAKFHEEISTLTYVDGNYK